MKNIPSLLLGFCLAASANTGLAQSIAQPDSIKSDISQFHGDQNTLLNALKATEQATGGKVIDMRFSYPNSKPTFNSVVLKGSQVQFFKIEQLQQNVVELDASSRPVWMLSWRGKADVHFAKQATASLSQAIRAAQQANNGAPAVAAGIARSASNPDSEVHAYTVLLDVRGDVHSVSIDITNGEVIADPSALRY
ncbi:MAG TPA: PepSY domain-containing protein [Steroidobacteraceae bacterium]|nr:PepSY domain-containing protein [Steroidobacteraceae bacterium]